MSIVELTPNTSQSQSHLINTQNTNTTTTTTSNNNVKKRTKVSRACDQCRKKKIKCGGDSEINNNSTSYISGSCYNCIRNGEKCTYQRIQLKRGPVKGYNKILKKQKKFDKSKNTTTNNNKSIIKTNIITPITTNLNNGVLNNNTIITNSGGSSPILNHSPGPYNNNNSILLPPINQCLNIQNTNTTNTNNNINNPHISIPSRNITVTPSQDIISNTTQSSAASTPGANSLNTFNFVTNNNNNLPSTNTLINSHIPHQNNINNINNNSTKLSASNLASQQFWKVPYHEFQHQRRNSLDSVASDAQSINKSVTSFTSSQQDQLLLNFNTSQPSNPLFPSNVAHQQQWSFLKNSPNFRKSRSNSNASQQSLSDMKINSTSHYIYPYSQFTQQQKQQQQQQQQLQSNHIQLQQQIFQQQQHTQITNNHNTNQVLPSTNYQDFQTRSSFAASDTYSSETPTGQQLPLIFPQNLDVRHQSTSSVLSDASKSRDYITNNNNNNNNSQSTGKRSKFDSNFKLQSNSNQNSNSNSTFINPIKPPSISSAISISEDVSANGTSTRRRDSTDVRDQKILLQYVKNNDMTDVELIDNYYEFIHMGFPIIPLNKDTLKNEILLINNQPISEIHETNTAVMLCFRNSLELLFEISLKGGNILTSILENHNDKENSNLNNLKDDDDNNHNNNNNNSKVDPLNTLTNEEKSQRYMDDLNRCFQILVDLHSKIRKNNDVISFKTKIIYFSTFSVLNYLLAYIGFNNSFILGMTVTVYHDFKLYEYFFLTENDNNNEEGEQNKNKIKNEDKNIEINQENLNTYKIIFKRLYILLIIYDSMQSCTFGSPKLIRNTISELIYKNFNDENELKKWCVDENPLRMKSIMETLKFGSTITDISLNRTMIQLISNRKNCMKHLKNQMELINEQIKIEENKNIQLWLPSLMSKLLLEKKIFYILLLQLKDINNGEFIEFDNLKATKMTTSLTNIISLILQILKWIMRLNPTNSIDFNYRPIAQLTSQNILRGSQEDNNNNHNNKSENEESNGYGEGFYKKLLGFKQEEEEGDSYINNAKGVLCPFTISILHEIFNIVEAIKQLPAILISLIMTMTSSNNKQNNGMNNNIVNLQELVVKLSSSMNEVVQITSLLSMIKPIKMHSPQHFYNNGTKSFDNNKQFITEKLFNYNNNDKITNDHEKSLETFIKVAFFLFDDTELGWM